MQTVGGTHLGTNQRINSPQHSTRWPLSFQVSTAHGVEHVSSADSSWPNAFAKVANSHASCKVGCVISGWNIDPAGATSQLMRGPRPQSLLLREQPFIIYQNISCRLGLDYLPCHVHRVILAFNITFTGPGPLALFLVRQPGKRCRQFLRQEQTESGCFLNRKLNAVACVGLCL